MRIRTIQYFLAASHGLVWAYCVWSAITTPHDSLWIMVWRPLFILDLPISLVLQLILIVTPEMWMDALDQVLVNMNTGFPYNYFWGFWLPGLLYGVFGTVWWYVLPSLCLVLWRRIISPRRSD